MPHNKNTDRTRRRILRWIALLGSISVAVTLLWPEVLPGEYTEQTAHDTAAASLAPPLITQTVELPADSPVLPPLLPPFLPDEELMAILAADYALIPPAPGYMQDVQVPFKSPYTLSTSPDLTPPDETDLEITTDEAIALVIPAIPTQPEPRPDEQTQPDASATLGSELAQIGARDLSPEPALAPSTVMASQPQTEMVVQDDSKGEFVKNRVVLQGNNLWSTLQQSDLNPHLKNQLEPLRRRLAQGNINRIQILYTDYLKNGESKAENSKILMVDGMRGASVVWSFYAREHDRKMSYYDYDGNAPELAMDRVPLQYSHITSEFNPARRHPITGRIQAHTGVDFKAAYGAPVHSTGKGTVTFAGWQSGYGRLVIVAHDNGYETRYAHLSTIDVDAGKNVARGERIGKVGNSGASTGTHLHFEVRINGTPYNPMTVRIPSVQPLPGNYLKAWHYRAEQYRLAMNELSATVKK